MNRTQKQIIAFWLVLPVVIACTSMDWSRKAAPYLLLIIPLFRGGIDSKAQIHRYFSTRRWLYAATIILVAAPMLWFLYRLIVVSGTSGELGYREFLPFIPCLILQLIYDRWLYGQSKGLRLPKTTD